MHNWTASRFDASTTKVCILESLTFLRLGTHLTFHVHDLTVSGRNEPRRRSSQIRQQYTPPSTRFWLLTMYANCSQPAGHSSSTAIPSDPLPHQMTSTLFPTTFQSSRAAMSSLRSCGTKHLHRKCIHHRRAGIYHEIIPCLPIKNIRLRRRLSRP